jgi:2-polyprenyl-3-methyl-5-hydroxy-6-metoxy-1,4-benzoquinol methylase
MPDYSIYYRKFHDGSKEHFDEMASFYGILLRGVLEPESRSANILDIGCGQGLLVYALKRMGFENVEGIDLSDEQVDVARKMGLRCNAVDEQYIARLSESTPATFNLIFLMDVLEHLNKEAQLQILASACALLVEGGRMVVSVPNANSSFGLRWRYGDWTHEAAFTEHSLEFVLLNSNFTSVTFMPYEFIRRPRLAFIPRRSSLLWVLQRFFRFFRRLEAVAEMGPDGWRVPLSLNLLAQCAKGPNKR